MSEAKPVDDFDLDPDVLRRMIDESDGMAKVALQTLYEDEFGGDSS